MKKAVLFLIFNRPETTQKVFEAIRIAKPPRLYIASDAARVDKEGESEDVIKTRKIVLDNIDWKCKVKTLFRDKNLGCRKSVSSAITWFFEQEKDGIILEDDVLPNESFFRFCEELLDRYVDNKNIMHIAGHRFSPNFKDNSTYYFAKIQHCWGWASWADRWQYYGTDLNNYNEENLKKFSYNLSVQRYWKDILHKMQNNEINSWAYQWTFKIIEKDGLCINPSENLVSNIGFGQKGTHTINNVDPFANLATYEIKEIIHPQRVELDEKAVNYIYQDHYGINFLQTEFDSKNIELNKTRKDLDSIKDILINTKSQLNTITSELDTTKLQLVSKGAELNKTNIELDSTNSQLTAITSELDSTNSQLTAITSELGIIKSQLSLKAGELDSRINELNTIYYSRGWRFLIYLRKVLNFVIPKESVRRKIVSFSYNFFKKSVKFILKTKIKIVSFFLVIKNLLVKRFVKKGSIDRTLVKKINKKSKKIVFVDHSFHIKTKSSGFMIDYLKQFFTVEIVLDDGWQGKPSADLSFVDGSYLGVIFWQALPSSKEIEKIKNDNIIHFPMYDNSVGLGLGHWGEYKKIKMVNFSKALHNKFTEWGFQSIYHQYFPEPTNFQPGKKDEVFFWQRLDRININTVVRLFNKVNLKIHLHRTIDPGQEFIQPDHEVEKRFKITYSDWFKTKSEMLEVIKQKGIYVAPREFEGIGMSFLEAMAMGKAVIAVDNPTMNEYIKHGENGYLFDFRNPIEIDLSNIENVQKNSYECVKVGYKKWKEGERKIIDFIKK